MNTTGTRATFLMNVSAAGFALFILVEAMVIEWTSVGHLEPGIGWLLCFFPVATMFAIRSEPFSFALLLGHLFVVLRLGVAIFNGEKIAKGSNPLFWLVLFAMATMICLVIYGVVFLAKSATSTISKRWRA